MRRRFEWAAEHEGGVPAGGMESTAAGAASESAGSTRVGHRALNPTGPAAARFGLLALLGALVLTSLLDPSRIWAQVEPQPAPGDTLRPDSSEVRSPAVRPDQEPAGAPLAPFPSGPADSSSWVPAAPATGFDGEAIFGPGDADEPAGTGFEGGPGTGQGGERPATWDRSSGQRSGRPPAAGAGAWSTSPSTGGVTAFGVYAGYPSTLGLQIVAPVSGTLAFRSGFTGFPGVGVAWTPGIEIRFRQEPGLASVDGPFSYANLLFGRTYIGDDEEYTALEVGIGYRWFLPDDRGVRWIAAAEFGGTWDSDSAWPDRPSLRVMWMLAD